MGKRSRGVPENCVICGLEISREYENRRSEEAESGVGVGQHLEKWGNRLRGASDNRVIGSLEIPSVYEKEREESGLRLWT